MSKRSIFEKIFLLVFFALLVTAVLAQESETQAEEDEEAITVAVKLGFGVWFKPDKWAPAQLIVENKEEPLEGIISIEAVPPGGGSTARYSQHYALYKDARKRFNFYIRCGRTDSLIVTLTNKGKTVYRQKFEYLPSLSEGDSLGLVMGADDGWRNFLDISPQKERRLVIVPVQEESLPEKWIGYDAVDFIIFEGLDLSKLTPSRIKALKDWIKAGGTVIAAVGASPRQFDNDFIREVFSVRPEKISAEAALLLAMRPLEYPFETIAQCNLKPVNGGVLPFGKAVNWLVLNRYGAGRTAAIAFGSSDERARASEQYIDTWTNILKSPLLERPAPPVPSRSAP